MRNLFRQSMRSIAMRATNFFGKGGSSFFSSGLTWLAGSQRDWNKDAGARYDNSAVFAAIQYLSRQITGDPRLVVQRLGESKQGKPEWIEKPSHQLPKIIKKGNVMGNDQLLGGAILSMVVYGNAYWIKDRALNGGLIGFVYVPHWRMRPIRDRNSPYGDRMADGTNLVTFYEYTNPDGKVIPLKVTDIVHFKWGIDPMRPEYGLSPIAAALREIVADNEAATLGAALLKQAGIPAIAISPKESVNDDLTPEGRQELNSKFQRRVTGDMAGTPFIAPFPCDYTVIGFSPDKLVLKESRALAVTRILSALGIDPMVLGFPSEQKTYSNFEEAVRHAWRSGCKPIIRMLGETIDEQVLQIDFAGDSDTQRVYWDLSQVAEEQIDIDKEADRLRKLFLADAITRSDVRGGLGYEIDENRDNVFYSQQKPVIAPAPPAEATKKTLSDIRALRAAEKYIDV